MYILGNSENIYIFKNPISEFSERRIFGPLLPCNLLLCEIRLCTFSSLMNVVSSIVTVIARAEQSLIRHSQYFTPSTFLFSRYWYLCWSMRISFPLLDVQNSAWFIAELMLELTQPLTTSEWWIADFSIFFTDFWFHTQSVEQNL